MPHYLLNSRNTKNLCFVFLILAVIYFIFKIIMRRQEDPEEIEDHRVLEESITRFGPVQNYPDLPGPELTNNNKTVFVQNTSNNYTFKFQQLVEDIIYNSRFEIGTIKSTNTTEILLVKGQFCEKLKRESGGYYIRTIGYILDEGGYRMFLLDLSVVRSKADVPLMSSIGTIGRSAVKATVIQSLTGGNNLG